MKNPSEKSVYTECAAVLNREAGLLKKIAALQELVRAAVINREWTDFEAHLAAIGRIGGEFEVLDQERRRIFALFSREGGASPAYQAGDSGDRGDFYALVSRFPREEGRELTALYRQLKLETLKIRLENEALMRYLSEGRAVVAGFLEAVFPDRKGRLYSRRGKQVQADMRSIVLNRHF
jgi:hypothetical protein